MTQGSRRLVTTLIPAILLGGMVVAAPTASTLASAATTPPIGFEVPRVADPIHTYGEPNIGVAPNQAPYVSQPSNISSGEVYVSGPTGTGTQRSIWQGSVDGGHTFRNIVRSNPLGVGPPLCSGLPVPVCGSIAAPGGGDTEINFDHNRKQYFADLYALACQQTATRTVDNTGKDTVVENSGLGPFGTLGGCPVPGSDRQWILVKDPALAIGPAAAPRVPVAPGPTIYMESNTVGAVNCTPGSGAWYRSTDGLSYVSAEPGQPGGVLSTYCPFGADGYPSIDQATGKVFQAEYDLIGGQPVIQLNIGTPLIGTNGDLCFLDHMKGTYTPLAPDPCAMTPRGPNANQAITVAMNNPALHDVVKDATEAANFVVTSMDSGRNLWVTWVNHAKDPKQHQAWVSVSPPGPNETWDTWSPPVQVSKPPSAVSIFPWIQSGSAGRADVVWYGDSTSAMPSDTGAKHVWDVYMSQVVFPLAAQQGRTALPRIVPPTGIPVDISATPTVTQVKVTPHPMDLTDVCLLGTLCVSAFGNRNLADFFEVRTDNTGAAMIVYDDMSNGYCQPIGLCPSNQQLDHAGSPVVTVARQSSGPGLFSNAITNQPLLVGGPSNAPVSGLADAAGDAKSPLFGGTNVPQLDILDHRLAVSGQTLTITIKLAGNPNDASGAASAAGCGPLCHVQYVTRWQMGTHLYYGMVENGPATGLGYFAGETKTLDDCSVSACDPHMLTYPESSISGIPTVATTTGSAEKGSITCPPAPSVANPCTIVEQINLADVGSPTSTSLLEEVAGYSFVSLLPQALITQAQERADSGATEIDGVCCYNFLSSGATPLPPITTPSPLPSTLPNTAVIVGAGRSVALPAALLALVLLGCLGLAELVRKKSRGR
ncbi:MAG: hypothetical protein ACR2MY_02360 [Candidatus Dormibacteria bacterium]